MSEGPIFVFGTNSTGHHENETAQLAVQAFGARRSFADGLSGRSYAIALRDREGASLPASKVVASFDRFKAFAKDNPHEIFLLSRLGCDSLGFTDEKMYPHFRDCPPNVRLPGVWRARQDPSYEVLAITGLTSLKPICVELTRDVLKLMTHFFQTTKPVQRFIVGDDEGVDAAAAEFLMQKGFEVEVVRANWDEHKGRAGAVRNRLMALPSTRVLLIDDGTCAKSAHMRKVAASEGLEVHECAISMQSTAAASSRPRSRPEAA